MSSQQASTSGAVAAGMDGQYRMTVDKRYSDMAGFRRWAIRCYPLWVAIGTLKLLWLVAPLAVSPVFVYKGYLISHILSFCGSLWCWRVAKMWGAGERFPWVMAFNVCALIATVMHLGHRFKYHTEKPEEHVQDSRVLTVAVLKMLPSLDPKLSPQISEYLKFTEKVVDVGMLVVGGFIITCLNYYIGDKKAINKEKKEYEAAMAARKKK